MLFNKSKIKSSFNQSNQSYNQNAILQKIVADNLFQLAKENISKAKDIVDLGSGTGFIADRILSNFPDKNIIQLDIAKEMLAGNPFQTYKIVADIEALPLKNNIFDLALSSLSFQWLNNLPETIPQILKTIKKHNSISNNFYFSLLGNESLKELKSSCHNCKINLSVNNFLTEFELRSTLNSLGLNYHIHSELILFYYDDLYELLKSIKLIGAGYSDNRGYLGKKQFELLNSFYLKNFNTNNKVCATWQVFYISI
jgi:malonyl-CoA O-methyltransferase